MYVRLGSERAYVEVGDSRYGGREDGVGSGAYAGIGDGVGQIDAARKDAFVGVALDFVALLGQRFGGSFNDFLLGEVAGSVAGGDCEGDTGGQAVHGKCSTAGESLGLDRVVSERGAGTQSGGVLFDGEGRDDSVFGGTARARSQADGCVAAAASGVRGTVPVPADVACSGVPGGFPSDRSHGVGRVPGVGVRGPNYAKNQAARVRRKIQREESKLAAAEARGRRQARMEAAQGRVGVRSDVEQRLHELRLERQVIQEERRLAKLKSPAQMVEDAMRQVAFAERCARGANDSKVAAWAAALSSASAESIARSTGSYEDAKPKVAGGEKKAGGSSVAGSSSRRSRNSVPVSELPRTVDGEVDERGMSLKADGTHYTDKEARNWLERHDYLKKHIAPGRTNEDVVKRSRCPVSVLEKYYRLVAQVERASSSGSVVGSEDGDAVTLVTLTARLAGEAGQDHIDRLKRMGLFGRKLR